MISALLDFGKDFKYEGWYAGSSKTPFSSLEFVVASSIGYLLMVRFFKLNNKHEKLTKFLLGVHNFVLCIASIIMFGATLGYVLREMYGSKAVGFFTMFCDANRTYLQSPLYFWTYIFYLSKVYEWIDTVFILVQGKQPAFLHVYHHLLTFWVAWVGLEVETTYAFCALLINCFIHSIMYFYYGCYCIFGTKYSIFVCWILYSFSKKKDLNGFGRDISRSFKCRNFFSISLPSSIGWF